MSMPNPKPVPDQQSWLTELVRARDAPRARSVLVLDPREKTVREVDVLMDFHMDAGGSASLSASKDALVESLLSVDAIARDRELKFVEQYRLEFSVHNAMDDRYMTVTTVDYADAGAQQRDEVPRAAYGFDLFGLVCAADVMILSLGRKLRSPLHPARFLDVKESLRANVVPEVRWLVPNQVATRRRKLKADARARAASRSL